MLLEMLFLLPTHAASCIVVESFPLTGLERENRGGPSVVGADPDIPCGRARKAGSQGQFRS